MKILKVISLLLDYPSDELFRNGNLDACTEVVNATPLLSTEVKDHVKALINQLSNDDSIAAQERYDGLFERGRSLSLWLFEHVHGESRDRGQAMVDLIDQYEQSGFAIGIKELPDYIPLYLEYLSHKADLIDDEIQIRMDIADVSHIIALLAARLKDRGSLYASCMNALLQIADKPLSIIDEFDAQIAKETPDNTIESIDKEWEEEVVDFLGAEQEERCPSSSNTMNMAAKKAAVSQIDSDVPVHWVGFDTAQSAKKQDNSTMSTNNQDVKKEGVQS